IQARAGVLRGAVQAPRSAAAGQHRSAQPMGRGRPRRVRVLLLRAMEHRRVPPAPPGVPAGRMGDRAAAWPARPGSRHRQRLQPGHLSPLAAQGAGLVADRIPVAPRGAAAVLRVAGRHAAAPFGVAGRRAAWRSRGTGIPRAAGTGQADPAGAGMGAHRHRDAAGRRARGPRRAHRGPGRRRDRPPHRRDPGQAALDARPRRARAMSRARTAWLFLTPALPVLGALGLSLTDYDLYALADIRNLRFVGLHNYGELLQRPLFWTALGNTFYFVVVGVPLSIGASLGTALLLNSPLARMKAFHRTVLFAPVVTTVVAVAVIWRYLFNTR